MDDVAAGIALYRKAREHGATVVGSYDALFPSVTVTRPADPRPEERLGYPTTGANWRIITDDELVACRTADALYAMVHSSAQHHLDESLRAELLAGTRPRPSLAPFAMLTGALMALETIKLLAHRDAVDCRGVFLDPWTLKVERPKPAPLAWALGRIARRRLPAAREPSVDVDLRPHRHVVVQPLDVLVGEAHAAVRDRGADGVRVRRAVDLVAVAELEAILCPSSPSTVLCFVPAGGMNSVLSNTMCSSSTSGTNSRLARLDDADLVALRREDRCRRARARARRAPRWRSLQARTPSRSRRTRHSGGVHTGSASLDEHGAHAARRLEVPRLAAVAEACCHSPSPLARCAGCRCR